MSCSTGPAAPPALLQLPLLPPLPPLPCAASLMETYLGQPADQVAQRIQWTADDPNLLQVLRGRGEVERSAA